MPPRRSLSRLCTVPCSLPPLLRRVSEQLLVWSRSVPPPARLCFGWPFMMFLFSSVFLQTSVRNKRSLLHQAVEELASSRRKAPMQRDM